MNGMYVDGLTTFLYSFSTNGLILLITYSSPSNEENGFQKELYPHITELDVCPPVFPPKWIFIHI